MRKTTIAICLLILIGCSSEPELDPREARMQKTMEELGISPEGATPKPEVSPDQIVFQKLIGKWRYETGGVKATITHQPNGGYHCDFKSKGILNPIFVGDGNAKGTWEVQDGHYKVKFTESNISHLPAGKITFEYIVDLTSLSFTVKTEDGRMETYRKVLTTD